MKFEMSLSHVTILVPSVRKAAGALLRYDFEIEEEESFEETKEIVVTAVDVFKSIQSLHNIKCYFLL